MTSRPDGSRLHAVVPYPVTNSSVRARVVQWFGRVDGAVIHGPGFDQAEPPQEATTLVLRNARRFTRGRREVGLLRAAGLGIYELDDGLPWDDGRLPDIGAWWKRPWRRSLVADRAARAADRVIAGNEVLADWAMERCADVRVVPTCVEPADYAQKTDYALGERPVVGWIGSAATEHFLTMIAPALRRLHEGHGARVELISGPGDVAVELQPFTTRIAWSEQATSRLAGWDVGVMPLRDGVYERAKCAYKLLQYAASGLPAVGSPIGVNAGILGEMDALAPASVDEWYDALAQLLTESAARREQRARCGRAVAEAYSYDRWEPTWRAAVGIDGAAER